MKKQLIITLVAILFLVVCLSGCTGSSSSSSGSECCVAGIIGVLLFIILIAYLLGHKKTKVETIIHQAPPIQEKVIYQNEGDDIDEAIKILKKRYAKGEITKEEYEQMKKDLEVD